MNRFFLILPLALAACDLPLTSPEAAAVECEERARAAQGPEVGVTLGVNSESGGFASGSVGVSSDFIRGRDPLAVYESCVFRLTGEAPVRSPNLR